MLPRHTKRTETSCFAVMVEEQAAVEGFESWGVPREGC